MGYFAEIGLRRALEDSLGDRLCAIAVGGAQLVGSAVLYLEVGEDDARSALSARKKLDDVLRSTGVHRALVIRLDGTTVLDSARKLRVGDPYVRAHLDASEVARVAEGHPEPSILFEGPEGRWYKSCYAPLREKSDHTKVAGALVVEGPASFFDVIGEMRARLVAIIALGFVALVALTAWAARRITGPLARLSDVARRIGAGELETYVPVDGPQEARVLAETMRGMAQSLAERDREMQVMLAGIAHEVRNPLGGIELFGGLLKEDLDSADPRSKHVDRILGEIHVLGGVVNDFLAFARKRPLEKQRVAVGECIEELLSSCERMAKEKTISLAREIELELTAVFDPNEVRRAIMNLVQNAIQATPTGGTVTIRASREPTRERIVFEVSDTGPGVPEAMREEIFRPFFTTKQKGTGLGLALVKKCATAHGGDVSVRDATGGGASFVLSLPLIDAPPPAGTLASGLIGSGELSPIEALPIAGMEFRQVKRAPAVTPHDSDDRLIDDEAPPAKRSEEPGLIDDDGTFEPKK